MVDLLGVVLNQLRPGGGGYTTIITTTIPMETERPVTTADVPENSWAGYSTAPSETEPRFRNETGVSLCMGLREPLKMPIPAGEQIILAGSAKAQPQNAGHRRQRLLSELAHPAQRRRPLPSREPAAPAPAGQPAYPDRYPGLRRKRLAPRRGHRAARCLPVPAAAAPSW